MGSLTSKEILITPLSRISVVGGDVLHALKSTEQGFNGFGEAYFSMIEKGVVKAWKKHQRMTLNLVVPVGEVRFVFYSEDRKLLCEESIGTLCYSRLTVPPGIWFGFQGLAAPFSLILNMADIPHDPDEVIRKPLNEFTYEWKGVD